MNVKLEGGLGNQLFQYAYGLANGAMFNRFALDDGVGHYPATYALGEFGILPDIDNRADQEAVSGDWQNEEHFLSVAEYLKEQLSLGIVIQVRRYSPEEESFHGNLTAQYFHDALFALRRHYPLLRVHVITDSPDWCSKNFLSRYPVINTGHRNTDMWLMAAASHIVISNSSFGWWGAWLGEREGRKVIAPGRWLRQKEHDICPPRWTQIWKESYFGLP